MSETMKPGKSKMSLPEDRKKALRSMRALLERLRNRMQYFSGQSNRSARRNWKKLKRTRSHMKQAFYEVTLADRKKWQKARPRIKRTVEKAHHTLEQVYQQR